MMPRMSRPCWSNWRRCRPRSWAMALACGLYANDRPDLAAGGGDFRIAQLARPSALADPIGGQAGFPIGGADVDVAAKADDISKAQALQELEQFDVAEAAVGQDRHGHSIGRQRLQTGQT